MIMSTPSEDQFKKNDQVKPQVRATVVAPKKKLKRDKVAHGYPVSLASHDFKGANVDAVKSISANGDSCIRLIINGELVDFYADDLIVMQRELDQVSLAKQA